MISPSTQLKFKYAFDRLLAAAALIMLSPFLLLIALLIKLDSRGSALFCQHRIGFQGKQFTVFKFRTMVQNADELLDTRGVPTADRITRVGHWLRRMSLDELPQLINILLGDMAVVGPRPGPAERHQRYTPWQQRRCEVRPGVTGLAQVSGRNTLPWSRRVELDIEYVDNYSWALDLRILLKTILVVFSGDGIVLDRNPGQADDIGQSAIPTSVASEARNAALPFHRIEPELVGAYRKDASFEHVLKALNDSLAECHDRELLDLEERFPTIHVIGAPRSGTTLLTQLVSSSLDVGYINNLIAAFCASHAMGFDCRRS